MTDKTCSTCKWVLEPGMYAKCGKLGDVRPGVDPLTGFVPFIKPAPYVEQNRHDPDKCGEEGRWWEAAEVVPEPEHLANANGDD